MRDFLFDYFSSRATSGTNLLGGRPGEVVTPRTGSASRVTQGRTADDRISEIDLLPLPGDTRSDVYWSSPQQLDARTRVDPAMLAQAQGMARLDRDRLAPVTPPMAATGQPAPPGNRPATPQTMPQAGGGRQPQPLLPSGRPEPARPNFLGRARDWLGGEAFPADQGMSRGMVLAQMLGNFGAGLSRTGRVGTGLEMANKGMWQARESEQERAEKMQLMELKRQALEQKVAPQPHVLGAGGMLVGAFGEVLARAPTAKKDPTTFEAAALNGTPEQRALALEQLAKKGEPTARDIAYIEHLRASGQHQKAMEEIERIKARRPAGAASQAAPPKLAQMMAARDALPPDHPDRRIWDAAIAKETAQTGSDQSGASDVFKRAGELRKEFAGLTKNEQEIVTAYGKIKSGFSLKTGAGDIAGIFGYMKMLDPTSAVREGEYATAANAGGVDQSIIAAYNRVLEGDKLTDEQRKEMTAAAGSQMGPYRERYDRLASQYAELAKRGQVDPVDVLGAGSPFPPPDQTAPPTVPGAPDPYEGLQ